ncbi:MAG: glucose-1-phosphate adenylyltransferase [Sarcina sp.]
MGKKEIIAMILAGGQGSRLGVLTKNLAKPAVPFGGKYRIIDFPLSNCSNSGIYTVGVLTQYSPMELHSHIGIGTPWDLDRREGGVSILPPYQGEKGADWYSGTANAIYQNIPYVDSYNPEYILILSGDHIYKMDYEKMLDFHKEKEATATIAVIEVPLEEASRFGIMNTNLDSTIYEFEEKPKNPKSNNASMGIYIFTWKKLKKYLLEDQLDNTSSKDFGKNIIPNMLNNEERMVAYPFKGYWKDVGTIDSLWEANMDLLDKECELGLYDEDWKICSVNTMDPPQYIGKNAIVKNSLIVEGCEVEGVVENSILFQGVKVEEGAVVRNSVIMPNTKISTSCRIEKAIIGSEIILTRETIIGDGQMISVIGSKDVIKEGE